MNEDKDTASRSASEAAGDNDAVYQALRQRIDQLPVPYPPTESGVELKLLKALFTAEEARVALHLSAIAEPVGTIHRRVPKMDRDRLASVLKRLAKKGAIVSGVTRVGSRPLRTYSLAPLVVGMFELQVDRLTPEFVRDFHDYLDQGFRASIMEVRTAQMRTVPVRAELSAQRSVASYEDMHSYLATHPGPFAVINCVCRQSAGLLGQACSTKSTHETCLMIGHVPSHGRELSRDAILEILNKCEREGHVLQPQNTRKPSFICCCCRDCCEILRNARKLPRPADAIPSAHRASVDAALCSGCRACLKRCPMDAALMSDGTAIIDEGRCIGCGLCVATCPVNAISLGRRRPAPRTPRSSTLMYLRMYRDRWGPLRVIGLAVRGLLGRKI
ncbi:MAG: 4Fe-4S dicluster domain-containing protein [Spirochaetaceae bacterium]|nr:MAG: 4Fe-4S dicluster domain-containing protein [Spirochaetaceae bacterium]